MGNKIGTEHRMERKLQLPLKYLKDITDNFSSDRKIGEGGFGVVYKGVDVKSGVVIAVKKLRPNAVVDQDKQFKNEANLLARVNHHNVVKFIGYCDETKLVPLYDENQQKYVVAERQHRLLCYEYLSNGSLDSIIFDESHGLDWQSRYKIIVGICKGLYYLHEGLDNTPIIHMDLKPSNILLDDRMEPKIADFGLSRLFSEEQSRTCTMNLIGSRGYMAPEYLQRGEISTKSDIYSLGILILEIITGKKNHQAMRNASGEHFIEYVRKNWTHMSQIASKHPSLGADCRQKVHKCLNIGLCCVEADRERRPSAGQMLSLILSAGGCTHKVDQIDVRMTRPGPLDVKSTDTVDEIKSKIDVLDEIGNGQQSLIFAGNPFNTDRNPFDMDTNPWDMDVDGERTVDLGANAALKDTETPQNQRSSNNDTVTLDPKVHLFVKTYEGRTLTMSMRNCDTAEDILKMIQEKLHTNGAHVYYLHYRGRVMSPWDTLWEHEVENNSTVDVRLRQHIQQPQKG